MIMPIEMLLHMAAADSAWRHWIIHFTFLMTSVSTMYRWCRLKQVYPKKIGRFLCLIKRKGPCKNDLEPSLLGLCKRLRMEATACAGESLGEMQKKRGKLGDNFKEPHTSYRPVEEHHLSASFKFTAVLLFGGEDQFEKSLRFCSLNSDLCPVGLWRRFLPSHQPVFASLPLEQGVDLHCVRVHWLSEGA